ncbi:hypothetical protein HDIA_4380 [Hartmannibacter diazotrophicus]|uniref:Lysozyme inhibitor LprI-like N-terminal domain-containing protein n=1 Tax=Hartmannibacter diazotrophicus TaxID=1482074 RepID=A0A2C9DDT5_9HYPH|nr:lysozyme inhibitor LprI family protein [Hartmannibacter diazotrophicus]SON57921.1 hypothetical protein HDIA_4380 [Hartmannibacter diazotrophicus]
MPASPHPCCCSPRLRPPSRKSAPDDCGNAQTQLEINDCVARDYDRADAELNAVWKKAIAEMKSIDADLPPEQSGAADALLKSQRAWIAYRDGQCEAAGFQFVGGSIRGSTVGGCLADLTRKRTAELQTFLETN